MIEGEAALAALLIRVFGLEAPPKPLHLIQPAIRAVTGEITLAEAAKIAGTTRSRMGRIVVSSNPVRAIIGGEIPALTLEAERSARQSLGQLLIGFLPNEPLNRFTSPRLGRPNSSYATIAGDEVRPIISCSTARDDRSFA
jgi:hypothetical protein